MRLEQVCQTLRVSQFRRVDVGNGNFCAVLDLELAQFVQQRPPETVLRQIFGHPFRTRMWPASPQSITRWAMLIPAPATLILSLTSLTLSTGPLCTPIRNRRWGMSFQRPGNLLGALDGFFRALEKHQRHSIPGRDANQLAVRVTFSELRSLSHDFIELVHGFALLVDQ